MSQKFTQVDAFADKPFTGNPAAVCVLPKPADERWMQSVALEMNLSETAFLVKRADEYDLRWFTPSVEVALCGHATLASSHVLWEDGHLKRDEAAQFQTKSGLLKSRRVGEWIELDFPSTPPEKAAPPPELLQSLGVEPTFVGKNKFDFLVEVGSEEVVRNLKPNFALLRSLGVRGVIVTSVATKGEFDFISRFFAPGSGIDEDPVTGSAHCCLGPYWSKRMGKKEFLAYQASARGGVVKVRCGDERVYLGGKAVTVLRGELLI